MIFLGLFGLAACAAVRVDQVRTVGELGYFAVRYPRSPATGFVIGVPHASRNPKVAALGFKIGAAVGAGYVGAHGFQDRQINVSQPLARRNIGDSLALAPSARASVFGEFRQVLDEMCRNDLRLYVGFRVRPTSDADSGVIQVAASGFSWEELALLKAEFDLLANEAGEIKSVPPYSLSIAPLDDTDWDSSELRYHGVLLVAKRGMVLRLPRSLIEGAEALGYQEVLSRWVLRVREVAEAGHPGMARLNVATLPFGRIDRVPTRKKIAGVVIGAPHGSFDEHTAELAKALSYRTGIAAVIAKGFSPTQAGGWRINVNRPSEKNFLAPEREIKTDRAVRVYEAYKKQVLAASGGRLKLYLDVHQYGQGESVQVATVGVTRAQAMEIKRRYGEIRDRIMGVAPGVTRVPFQIEPLDAIEIGAWPAKAEGLLGVAERSLHFELPAHTMLRSAENRTLYGEVLAELFADLQNLLP